MTHTKEDAVAMDVQELLGMNKVLGEQNAELVEALEGCVEEMWRVFEEHGVRASDAYTQANEAIQKARGA